MGNGEPPALALRVSPDQARPGDEVKLSSLGDGDGDEHVIGGVDSIVEEHRDGEWVPVFYLFCRWGGREPTCREVRESDPSRGIAVPAVGLPSPVVVVVPDVRPGVYRIRRTFSLVPHGGGRAVPVTTYADLVVAGAVRAYDESKSGA